MANYLSGYDEAQETVKKANLQELLSIIDSIYGRGNLRYGDSIKEVRIEALAQIEAKFRDAIPCKQSEILITKISYTTPLIATAGGGGGGMGTTGFTGSLPPWLIGDPMGKAIY